MWYDEDQSTILNEVIKIEDPPEIRKEFTFEIEDDNSTRTELYKYLAKCYDLTNPIQSKIPPESTLKINKPDEEWIMTKVWPTKICFGYLGEPKFELTIRFEDCIWRNLKTD